MISRIMALQTCAKMSVVLQGLKEPILLQLLVDYKLVSDLL